MIFNNLIGLQNIFPIRFSDKYLYKPYLLESALIFCNVNIGLLIVKLLLFLTFLGSKPNSMTVLPTNNISWASESGMKYGIMLGFRLYPQSNGVCWSCKKNDYINISDYFETRWRVRSQNICIVLRVDDTLFYNFLLHLLFSIFQLKILL